MSIDRKIHIRVSLVLAALVYFAVRSIVVFFLFPSLSRIYFAPESFLIFSLFTDCHHCVAVVNGFFFYICRSVSVLRGLFSFVSIYLRCITLNVLYVRLFLLYIVIYFFVHFSSFILARLKWLRLWKYEEWLASKNWIVLF